MKLALLLFVSLCLLLPGLLAATVLTTLLTLSLDQPLHEPDRAAHVTSGEPEDGARNGGLGGDCP